MPVFRDQTDLLNSLIDQFHGDNPVTIRHGVIAPQIRRALQSMAEQGDLTALDLMDHLTDQAIAAASHKRADQKSRYLISHHGRLVSKPEYAGLQVRNTRGQRTRIHQAKLWYELNQAEYAEWIANMAAQIDSLYVTVETHRAILALWSQHPTARTPYEVCELAGIDPARIDIAI